MRKIFFALFALMLAFIVPDAQATTAWSPGAQSFIPNIVDSGGGYGVGSYEGPITMVISPTGEVTNAVAKGDGVSYVGPQSMAGFGSTWTLTRESAGIYSYVRTADNTVGYLLTDVTGLLRTAANKGLKLTSIQYAFGIGVATPTAHTLAVYKVAFTDNAAPTVTNVLAPTAIYKTAGTVTSPYIRTATIPTPAFLNPLPTAAENDKWLIEINLDASGTPTTTYRFYGLWLIFTHDMM